MVDKNYNIAITTFSKRLPYVSKLIEQIRKYNSCNILIGINGDYNQSFPEDYRISMLELCTSYNNTYPIFFPSQRGLAKIWNTLVIHSTSDWVLVLNDDIEILSHNFFKNFEEKLKNQLPDLCKINGSFSHYAIHREIANDVGWFDERLLGFGEEDGDFLYRYIEKYNREITHWSLPDIINICTNVRDDNIRAGVSKYSAFNREFCFLNDDPKYSKSNTDSGIIGMYGCKHIKNKKDLIQYPYESFFWENQNKL